jgi:hypothetical protein
VHRPWIVRTVALLLVLVGLQAGAFHDLETGHEWYFGTEDNSAAVMSVARKADPAIDGVPVADAPSALPLPVHRALECRTTPEIVGACAPRAFLPDPTGPPRA